MVYARRRRYGRRAGRRGSRTLSTRNIFNRKGSKAQAAQISALKKRINRVYRRTRPETKVLSTGTENRFFGPQYSDGPNLLNATILSVSSPGPGSGDNQRVGNKITMYPLNFYMNVRYTETNQIIDNVYPYIQQPLSSNGMMLRFVAIQAIAADSSAPSIADIFQENDTAAGTVPQDLMMMMTMPFRSGITARYKILKDKRINVNQDKPLYAARFKVKPVIKSLRWEVGKDYPAGQIYYCIIAAGGDLKISPAQSGTQEIFFNYNYLDTTWRYELPYTDA